MSSTEVQTHRWRPLVLALIVAVGAAELAVSWLALHPQVSANYRAYYIDQTTTCLDKPVSGGYVLGATVSFMPDDQPAARQLRVCGWDGPVGDGTHSVGTSSVLRFAVAQPGGDLTLAMLLTTIAAPDGRDQHIIVTGNGTPLGDLTIPDSTTRLVELPVPASAIANGQLDVTLAYPTATEMTPRDSDTHFRSIKLLSVQLRRPGDAPMQGPQDDPVAQRHRAPPDGPNG